MKEGGDGPPVSCPVGLCLSIILSTKGLCSCLLLPPPCCLLSAGGEAAQCSYLFFTLYCFGSFGGGGGNLPPSCQVNHMQSCSFSRMPGFCF